MIKVSHFLGDSGYGLAAIPLFGPGDSEFEKVAANGLLPEVIRYISGLRPANDSQYVLVNAMGAGEYYSSNINADFFGEDSLIHKPDTWTGNPLIDRPLSVDWAYGFPTFYNAHAFAHHKNKDASRAYGDVELAAWSNDMKRVELVVRVDRNKCEQFGGMSVWDKLKSGDYPDVSMGSKVPWDRCSICTDLPLYQEALDTFEPSRHKHPGIAVLDFHKALKEKNGIGIRGISVTRADYCEHMLHSANKILPDGRKVFVYNDFPRFFDISFVFIGADRTAKVMVFIVRAGQQFTVPSSVAAAKMGLDDHNVPDPGVKTASVEDAFLERYFLKQSEDKKGEIEKDVVPSQFAGKAIPVLTKSEPDLSEDMLSALSSVPLPSALATTSGLGMVLKPDEFSQVLEGGKDAEPAENISFGAEDFNPALARMLLPALSMRSALGPYIERRVVVVSGSTPQTEKRASSLSSTRLRKIGSVYNSYRHSLMNTVASAQDLLGKTAKSSEVELRKLAEAPAEELFTPLAFRYLKSAFMEDMPFADTKTAMVESKGTASVERGLPSRNTWMGN